MANLVEAYKSRLSISESVFKKTHQGESMNSQRKLATAVCLNNVNKFMNEAFANSAGTQAADMGQFKKFCLNLTTVAVPNLIANDLVIVSPMTSMSGFITYIQYTAGTNKGATTQGTVLNDPFKLGNVDSTYTSDRVAETKVGNGTTKDFTVAWTPVVAKSVQITVAGVKKEEGSDKDFTVDTKTGKITFKTAPENEAEISIGYLYDNVVIPQNDIPMVSAKMESISLIAKARRVAVYYSQIAAYQAKTDYGFDLGDQLAEKAVGQLAYEIDTEVTDLLIDIADRNTTSEEKTRLTWSRVLPYGVSKADHYEGFSEIIEIGKQIIYDKTKRFAPNYMLIASDILPILTFIKGWQAAPVSNINGPYFAGTLNGIKVFVTPNIAAGKFVLGVNGDDYMSSAAVYAPYMLCVPTQLLQYADGGTTQGFSTLYDLKELNPSLVIVGEVNNADTQVVKTKEQG